MVDMKRLMLLGGVRYLLPVIKTAHEMGVEVITADYLPDNIAHRYSDKYVNVSILDREAVLKAAQELKIDGIMSFGVDPGVVTAAYVADKMGLPYPPLKSCEILQNKDRFRDFLQGNGFNCPWHCKFDKSQAASEIVTQLKAQVANPFPCIVKPVDSAGSKGCTRVDAESALSAALSVGFAASHNGRIIIEQFLEKEGPSSDSDCFSVDDKLVFASFNCQHFDSTAPNPYTPAGFSWPSVMPKWAQIELRNELQRLLNILHMGSSVYNVETRIGKDGKPYIMEVSPRGGGNRLSEMLKFACGQDLIANGIRVALGEKPIPMTDPVYEGTWAELVVHSNASGEYLGLNIDKEFRKYVVQENIWVKRGDQVPKFTGANQTIGTLVLKFDSHVQAEGAIECSSKWCEVVVK